MIDGGLTGDRRLALPRLMPRRVRSWRTLILVVALVGCGLLGWLWYRGSSFVKVTHVTVTGLSGPDVIQIRGALTDAALRMTTLNIDVARLESSVSSYRYVQSLTVATSGAHGVVISVHERLPIAYVAIGSRRLLADGAGLLLPGGTVAAGMLPVVPLPAGAVASTGRAVASSAGARTSGAGGAAISSAGARAALAVLAAAPYAMLAHVASATSSNAHGVILQLRHGPQLYFGAPTQLASKWNSAVSVLQDRSSAGAAYIDVTDPQRPAAGYGVSPTQASALGLTG